MFLVSRSLKLTIPLNDLPLEIGRSDNCDVVIELDRISRHHLRVDRIDGIVQVCDEGSSNLTRLNGVVITRSGWHPIQPHDRITLADCAFEVLETDTDAASDDTSRPVFVGTPEPLPADASESWSLSLSNLPGDESSNATRLQALVSIIHTLRDVIHTQDVLERAVAILFKIFPQVERGAICMTHETSGKLAPRWWQSRDDALDQPMQISQSIAKHVMETGEAFLTRDVKKEFTGESVHGLPVQSIMACPILNPDNQSIGLVIVDASKPRAFTTDDLELFAAVTLQISLAINCAQLHAQTVQDEVLRLEMEQARAVQAKYLPSAPPSLPGYEVAGFYRPARHVGGDYIDYQMLPDGRLAIVLGDVVGKGVPAAMTMVRLANETRAGLQVVDSAHALVQRLNRALEDDFITFIVCLLDPQSGGLTICNAGHPSPLRRTPAGSVQPIGFEQTGLPLGIEPDLTYQESQLTLHPGESLLVFSDGITDQEQARTEQRIGMTPLCEWFTDAPQPATQVIENLVHQVDEFAAGYPQSDDMCMICLRRTNTPH